MFEPPRATVDLRTLNCRVSVVMPARNEASNLPYVLPRIPVGVHEVILVDGHSIDATVETARKYYPDIRIVHQTGHGKGDALRLGFAKATGDIIVMLDADGSTDPAEIPSFVSTLLGGADYAKGSRFLHGGGTADMPYYRRVGNTAFVTIVRLLFGGRYSDLCYGYNAFWRSVVERLRLDGDGFEIESMMNVRALRFGLRIVEVPSFEDRRIHGMSHLRTIPDGWRVLKALLREWRAGKSRSPHIVDLHDLTREHRLITMNGSSTSQEHPPYMHAGSPYYSGPSDPAASVAMRADLE